MTRIVWDKLGERLFETGIDRGVLYLPDSSGVAWNGLTSVNEDFDDVNVSSYFQDGVKFNEVRTLDAFSATLTAFTFPDEFLQFDGISSKAPNDWLYFGSQPVTERFGLSYRTKIGNDIDGAEHGYKLHLLYNLTADPNGSDHQTQSASPTPSEFSWKITGLPIRIEGIAPTVHLIIDSRMADPLKLSTIEDALYGTTLGQPRLPSPDSIIDWHLITITDNGDGTWTAEGPAELITRPTPTSFQIDNVNATYLDADTYEVSTTD